MAFGTLEDLEGSFDLVIFARVFAEHMKLLQRAKLGAEEGARPTPLVLRAKLEAGDPPKLLVNDVIELEHAEQRLAGALRVRLLEVDLTRDRLQALRSRLQEHAGDCAVYAHITIPGESETVLCVSGIRGVEPSAELCREIDSLFGRAVAQRELGGALRS